MTCKDCLHYDLCRKIAYIMAEITGKIKEQVIYIGNNVTCIFFKDKSRIIELPNIEIGQELFYIDQYEKRVKSDTVSKLTFEKNDLGIDTGVWSEDYGFSMFFSDVGKSLFLTKGEAEAKLKELNENKQFRLTYNSR